MLIFLLAHFTWHVNLLILCNPSFLYTIVPIHPQEEAESPTFCLSNNQRSWSGIRISSLLCYMHDTEPAEYVILTWCVCVCIYIYIYIYVLLTKNYFMEFFLKVHCQIFSTQHNHCDFCTQDCINLHVERVYPDEYFGFQNVSRVKQFFTTSILTGIVGKVLFSNPAV